MGHGLNLILKDFQRNEFIEMKKITFGLFLRIISLRFATFEIQQKGKMEIEYI